MPVSSNELYNIGSIKLKGILLFLSFPKIFNQRSQPLAMLGHKINFNFIS